MCYSNDPFLTVCFLLYRYIKASSPKLNTIIITGFVISLLVPLFLALVVSAHEYGISPGAGDVLCQVCIQSRMLATFCVHAEKDLSYSWDTVAFSCINFHITL